MYSVSAHISGICTGTGPMSQVVDVVTEDEARALEPKKSYPWSLVVDVSCGSC